MAVKDDHLTRDQAIARIQQYKKDRKVHTDLRCECERPGVHKLSIDNYNELIHYLFNKYLK